MLRATRIICPHPASEEYKIGARREKQCALNETSSFLNGSQRIKYIIIVKKDMHIKIQVGGFGGEEGSGFVVCKHGLDLHG